MIRLASQKKETIILIKTVTPCKIFQKKHFPRNSCSKGFSKFRLNVSGGVHLQKSCSSQVVNFTKNRRLRLVVPLGIWKIFRVAISWTPAARYLHCYVMPRSSFLVTRVFNLYLFQWQHREITLSVLFIIFYQDHLLFFELGFYCRITVVDVSYLLASNIR